MNFENQRSGNGGVLALMDGKDEVGRLTYTIFPDDNKIIISYVLVHSKYEGQGNGQKLVDEAIQFARNNKWKVYPHCSYARSVMMRKTDIDDIFLK